MIKALSKFTLVCMTMLIITQLLVGCNNTNSIVDDQSTDTENAEIADTKSETTSNSTNITENTDEEEAEVIIVDTSVPEEDSEVIIVDTATSDEEAEVIIVDTAPSEEEEIIIIDTAPSEEETEISINNTYISEEDAWEIAREYWNYTEQDKSEGSTIMIYDGLNERSDSKTYHSFRLRWWVGSNWSTIDYLYIDPNTGECFSYIA